MPKHSLKHLEDNEFIIKNFDRLSLPIQHLIASDKIPNNLLTCICEICYNIQKRILPLTEEQKKKLMKYKSGVRTLGNHSSTKLIKRKKVKQVGRGLLPILFSIVTPIISRLLTSLRK